MTSQNFRMSYLANLVHIKYIFNIVYSACYQDGDRELEWFYNIYFKPHETKFISERVDGMIDMDRDGGLSCPLQVISTKQFDTDFLLAGDCLFSSS